MKNAYRDDTLAAQQRADALRQQVEARARRMNPALREWLPVELQQRLQTLEASVRTNATSLDGLRVLGDALTRLSDAMDEAIALAPSLEAGGRALAQQVRDPNAIGFRWLSSNADPSTKQMMQLSQELHRLVGHASWDREGRFGYRARFRRNDAPFALVSEFICTGSTTFEVSTAIATSVARGVPKLRLSPENLTDTWFRKPLRLVRDTAVGDLAFDGIFLVDTDPDTARVLLPAQVRKDLLDLAREGVPSLTVAAGVAEIRWVFELRERSFERAMRVLLHVRNAPVQLSLLRDA